MAPAARQELLNDIKAVPVKTGLGFRGLGVFEKL